MPQRHDTEWPDPIAEAQPSKNCACKFPRTQLKHCQRLFQGDAASIRKDVGGSFSVTRRTARTLPLYEWVSRLARLAPCPIGRPSLPARYALGRRTLWRMACQSMAYDSAAWLETAPTVFAVV